MTQEEKEDKKWLDDYYWNIFYIAHYNAGWRCFEQNNDD